MTNDLVSVVIPVYNAESFIKRTIDSVLQQTYKSLEIVAVDDFSNDNTWEILKQYTEDTRVKIYRLNENSGSAYAPLKKGVELSNSNWIINLGNDDILEANYIEKLISKHRETGASIVLGQMIFVNEKNVELYRVPNDRLFLSSILTGKDAFRATIGGWKIGGNGALAKKTIYEDVWRTFGCAYTGMNADELQTRQLFLMADKVVTCDAHYYYLIHDQSITHKFSLKLFDVLKTNRLLKCITKDTFGPLSTEARLAEYQCWVEIFHCSVLLHNHKNELDKKQIKGIHRLIYNEWKDVDWLLIRSKLKCIIIPLLFCKKYWLFNFTTLCWAYAKRIKTIINRC